MCLCEKFIVLFIQGNSNAVNNILMCVCVCLVFLLAKTSLNTELLLILLWWTKVSLFVSLTRKSKTVACVCMHGHVCCPEYFALSLLMLTHACTVHTWTSPTRGVIKAWPGVCGWSMAIVSNDHLLRVTIATVHKWGP